MGSSVAALLAVGRRGEWRALGVDVVVLRGKRRLGRVEGRPGLGVMEWGGREGHGW